MKISVNVFTTSWDSVIFKSIFVSSSIIFKLRKIGVFVKVLHTKFYIKLH